MNCQSLSDMDLRDHLGLDQHLDVLLASSFQTFLSVREHRRDKALQNCSNCSSSWKDSAYYCLDKMADSKESSPCAQGDYPAWRSLCSENHWHLAVDRCDLEHHSFLASIVVTALPAFHLQFFSSKLVIDSLR